MVHQTNQGISETVKHPLISNFYVHFQIEMEYNKIKLNFYEELAEVVNSEKKKKSCISAFELFPADENKMAEDPFHRHILDTKVFFL